MQMTLKPS